MASRVVREVSRKSRAQGYYRKLDDGSMDEQETETLDVHAEDVFAVERVVERRRKKVQ